MVKFWQFLHTIWPSSLEACSPRIVLRSVFFLDSNHCKTACVVWGLLFGLLPNQSHASPLGLTQQVTFTSVLPLLVTFNHSWGFLLLLSERAPMVAPPRTACPWPLAQDQWLFRLNASATALSHPFWYSNWKLNFARPPTHQ